MCSSVISNKIPLIYILAFLTMRSCRKEEWKWLSLVLFLVWLRPSAGIWEQNHWDVSGLAELSTWIFCLVATILRHSSSFVFCPSTDAWYKEKYLSLLCDENGSILNLVLLEVKYYINMPDINGVQALPCWSLNDDEKSLVFYPQVSLVMGGL